MSALSSGIDMSTPQTITIVDNDIDTDGDGVINSIDIDDDNDGILDVNEVVSPHPLFAGDVAWTNISGTTSKFVTANNGGTMVFDSTGGGEGTTSQGNFLEFTHNQVDDYTNSYKLTVDSGKIDIVRFGVGLGLDDIYKSNVSGASREQN